MKKEDFFEIKLYVFVTYFLIAGLLTGFLTSALSIINNLSQYDLFDIAYALLIAPFVKALFYSAYALLTYVALRLTIWRKNKRE
ncbi:MAG: hypothetical protein Q8K57_08370 [Thiobacillus sp.]|nr:hypothetical protein [Thiobacillus sp.]MDP1924780.1 hypothetical protein [Thiobacillus sp.]MDP3126720.1 hypothetical protein [Thiobacillus sp.]